MIQGFIINKFRGDPALFDKGYAAIEQLSGWRGFGLVHWLPQVARLPSEDAVVLERRRDTGSGRVTIACPILPRISNFDDLDPLKLEEAVDLVMVPPGRPIPAETALIVLPGSKATIADLAFLRAQGWDIDIAAHVRRGGQVLGLCGGYQMLGRRIADPDGVEGPPASVEGLGLLDVETVLGGDKALVAVRGRCIADDAPFHGYEMHIGTTRGADCDRPMVRFDDGRLDGARSADGRIMGTYVHGLFADAAQRAVRLRALGASGGGRDYDKSVDRALDEIATALERHLDIDGIIALSKTVAD